MFSDVGYWSKHAHFFGKCLKKNVLINFVYFIRLNDLPYRTLILENKCDYVVIYCYMKWNMLNI